MLARIIAYFSLFTIRYDITKQQITTIARIPRRIRPSYLRECRSPEFLIIRQIKSIIYAGAPISNLLPVLLNASFR